MNYRRWLGTKNKRLVMENKMFLEEEEKKNSGNFPSYFNGTKNGFIPY